MELSALSLLLFVTLSQWLSRELAQGLLLGLAWSSKIHLIFWPTIVSGSLALFIKYLAALRLVPVCKLVSGSLALLLLSWYLDRILKHNSYLMVRAVGVAIIVVAALGVVIVGEAGDAPRQALVVQPASSASSVQAAPAERVAQVDYGVRVD